MSEIPIRNHRHMQDLHTLDRRQLPWLFRYVITESIHGHFQLMPHESDSYSRGKAIHIQRRREGVSVGVVLGQRL